MASFFLDNDANRYIGRQLEHLGHVLTSTHAQHIEQASDTEVLRWATGGGLILVTHNGRDFVDIHRARTVDPHAGILVLPQVRFEDVEEIAIAVDRLISSRNGLANELYRLRADLDWWRWDAEQQAWAQSKL